MIGRETFAVYCVVQNTQTYSVDKVLRFFIFKLVVHTVTTVLCS